MPCLTRTKGSNGRSRCSLRTEFRRPGALKRSRCVWRVSDSSRCVVPSFNRPLEEWGKLLGDVPAAGAILDRFLHHAQVIAIKGRSYRVKDSPVLRAAKESKFSELTPAAGAAS